MKILATSKIIGRNERKDQKKRNRLEQIVGITRVWMERETNLNNQVCNISWCC